MRQIFKKIHQRFISINSIEGLLNGCLYLAIGVCVLFFALQLPLSEKAAYLFRHGYGLWLLAAVILLCVSFMIPGTVGRLVSYSLVLILFTLPLTALWQQGYAEMQMIGGVLPFSDSAQYYHNASRLLEGYPFTPFGTRHPFAPALIASLLAITGHHLMRTTAILVFLNASSVFLTVKILRKSQHAVVAAVFVVLAFLFYRRFIGMIDTENLGMLFGMLGFDLLFIGACTRKTFLICSGTLITSFGLNARPGAFFVLPALLVWYLVYFHRNHRTRVKAGIILVVAAMLIPFLLNTALAASLGSGEPGLFSNFAYTLYGIADGGSGWEQIYLDHPEIHQLSDSEAAQLTFHLAVEKIKAHPEALSLALRISYFDFFSLKNRSAFGYISGGDLTAFNQVNPDQVLGYKIARALLWFLSLSGIVWLWRHRQHAENGMLLWGLLGILFSVPFLPPRDAGMMRVYAATMPFLFLLPIYGVRWVLPKSNEIDENPQVLQDTTALASISAVALIILTVLGSLSLRLFRKPVTVMDHTCPTGAYAGVLRVNTGSYLYVQSDGQGKLTRMPVIQYSKFIQRLRKFPNADKVEKLSSLTPPYLLMNAVNLQNGDMLWAVAPRQTLEDINQPLLVCGHWIPELMENGLGFLFIDTYSTLE